MYQVMMHLEKCVIHFTTILQAIKVYFKQYFIIWNAEYIFVNKSNIDYLGCPIKSGCKDSTVNEQRYY